MLLGSCLLGSIDYWWEQNGRQFKSTPLRTVCP